MKRPSLNAEYKMRAAIFAALAVYILNFGTVKSRAEAAEVKSTPAKVAAVLPYPPLERALKNQSGWIGADGAYSIALPNGKNVWLFGDTLIGKIEGKRRVDSRLVHNSIAIEKGGSFKYYWGKENAEAGKRRSTGYGFFGMPPGEPNRYFWPADGFFHNGKLYIFLHAVQTNLKLPAPFQFEMRTDHLLEVQNPLAEPTQWQWKNYPLLNRSNWLLYGVAVRQDKDYIYVFCANGGAALGTDKNPTVLARLAKKDLPAFRPAAMQWLTETDSARREWLSNPKLSELIIKDGASEMSITEIAGQPGLFAFYIPAPGGAIMMRQAERPEGPWSSPVPIYKLPKTPADRFYYSCKAHRPSTGSTANSVILTYCTNMRQVTKLFTDSEVYFPKALLLKLAPKAK